jgi:hypothetical protein
MIAHAAGIYNRSEISVFRVINARATRTGCSNTVAGGYVGASICILSLVSLRQ